MWSAIRRAVVATKAKASSDGPVAQQNLVQIHVDDAARLLRRSSLPNASTTCDHVGRAHSKLGARSVRVQAAFEEQLAAAIERRRAREAEARRTLTTRADGLGARTDGVDGVRRRRESPAMTPPAVTPTGQVSTAGSSSESESWADEKGGDDMVAAHEAAIAAKVAANEAANEAAAAMLEAGAEEQELRTVVVQAPVQLVGDVASHAEEEEAAEHAVRMQAEAQDRRGDAGHERRLQDRREDAAQVHLLRAALAVQALVRARKLGLMARREVAQRSAAVVVVQKNRRAAAHRVLYVEQEGAVTQLQAVKRGHSSRKFVPRLRAAKLLQLVTRAHQWRLRRVRRLRAEAAAAASAEAAAVALAAAHFARRQTGCILERAYAGIRKTLWWQQHDEPSYSLPESMRAQLPQRRHEEVRAILQSCTPKPPRVLSPLPRPSKFLGRRARKVQRRAESKPTALHGRVPVQLPPARLAQNHIQYAGCNSALRTAHSPSHSAPARLYPPRFDPEHGSMPSIPNVHSPNLGHCWSCGFLGPKGAQSCHVCGSRRPGLRLKLPSVGSKLCVQD